MEKIIDRLDKYKNIKGLNDNKISTKIGISRSILGKCRKENRDISRNVVEKILKEFTDINKVWLFTGEGDMLKKEVNQIGENNYYNSKGEQYINSPEEVQRLKMENQMLREEVERLNKRIDEIMKTLILTKNGK